MIRQQEFDIFTDLSNLQRIEKISACSKLNHKYETKNLVEYISSPLNYIGGKYKLLNQIIPLFPNIINNFVDVFAGGFNVGINVDAKQIVCNDYMPYLIDLYRHIALNKIEDILFWIEQQIATYGLNKSNEDSYVKFRNYYNGSRQDPLDLYILICFSFNHQIRFNSQHKFNNPFGRNRSTFNDRLKNKLIAFHQKIQSKNIEFSNKNFQEIDYSYLSSDDLVYCDPPYLISTGSYNDGKRGFEGWNLDHESKLLGLLDKLHNNNIKFALSNVLVHKKSINYLLVDWSKQYNVHHILSNYRTSNYRLKDRNSDSVEVLITNY
jgi:DNA adenine methylase Dam